ncbi:MAG: PA2817 family protein [Halioglobus sp.]
MNDAQYASHCRELLAEFAANMTKRLEHLPEGDSLRELADRFSDLQKNDGDLYADGATLVSRLFTTYPDFAPTFPRDLLWFLGGECLHYMPDEEIAAYQKLDDMRYAAADKGETLNLREARASLLSLQ